MRKTVNVQDRVCELVKTHGSYRAAAKATGTSFTYLSELVNGTRDGEGCTVAFLRKIGLTLVRASSTKEHAHRK